MTRGATRSRRNARKSGWEKKKAYRKAARARAMTTSRFRDVVSAGDMQEAYALLRHFDRACRRIGVDYAMDGGMLVGSMLHHGRIPWDDDFDAYVAASDERRLVRALSRDGYVVASVGPYSKLWSGRTPKVDNGRPWNWPFLDIGWLAQNRTHVWERRSVEPRYRGHVYPREWVFPSVRRPYGPLVLAAPRAAARLLAYRFGPEWARWCVVNHWDHRRERWRYAGKEENTRLPCAEVADLDLVQQRGEDSGGRSVEWVANARRGTRGPAVHFLAGSVVQLRAGGEVGSETR